MVLLIYLTYIVSHLIVSNYKFQKNIAKGLLSSKGIQETSWGQFANTKKHLKTNTCMCGANIYHLTIIINIIITFNTIITILLSLSWLLTVIIIIIDIISPLLWSLLPLSLLLSPSSLPSSECHLEYYLEFDLK